MSTKKMLLLFVLVSVLLMGCQEWGFQPIPTRTLPATAALPLSPTVTPKLQVTTGFTTSSPVLVSPTPYPTCYVRNTAGDVLNVRTGPGKTFPILGALLPGERVTIIGDQAGWYQIKTTNHAGWIYGKFCEE